jgi:predicted nucleic acid-binding protein
VEAGSDCIITEDRELLRRGEYESIKIMRAGEFLREIQPGRER